MLIALLVALAVDSWQLAASSTSANGQLPTVNFSFSMRGDRARGWPVKTRVSLVSPAFTKEWTIDASRFRSKSRNSPYAGWKVRGRAWAVIVGGEIKVEN